MSIMKIDFCSTETKIRVVLVDEGGDFFFGMQAFVNFISKLSATDTMDDDQLWLHLCHGQLVILFKIIQLNLQNFKIAKPEVFIADLFDMNIYNASCRF